MDNMRRSYRAYSIFLCRSTWCFAILNRPKPRCEFKIITSLWRSVLLWPTPKLPAVLSFAEKQWYDTPPPWRYLQQTTWIKPFSIKNEKKIWGKNSYKSFERYLYQFCTTNNGQKKLQHLYIQSTCKNSIIWTNTISSYMHLAVKPLAIVDEQYV